jgi:hypothetical protein
MRLPTAHSAVVDLRKLIDYSLNKHHEAGKHKARVFEAALGLTSDDAGWLRELLLLAALKEDLFEGMPSSFGKKYVMDITISRSERSARVRSTWIVENGKDFPRLTSCYVL